MTVKFSNLQINALRLFMEGGHQGLMNFDEFTQIDQRITSGLGRRKIPFLRKIGSDTFALTREGMDAWKLFESTDVFRKIQSTSIAKCFATTKMGIVRSQRSPGKARSRAA